MVERNDAVRERGCGIGGGVRAAAGRTAARAVVRGPGENYADSQQANIIDIWRSTVDALPILT